MSAQFDCNFFAGDTVLLGMTEQGRARPWVARRLGRLAAAGWAGAMLVACAGAGPTVELGPASTGSPAPTSSMARSGPTESTAPPAAVRSSPVG